jgi:hypothetical protein
VVHCTDVRRNAPRVVEIGGAFFMRRSSVDYKVQEWHALNLSLNCARISRATRLVLEPAPRPGRVAWVGWLLPAGGQASGSLLTE